MTCDPHPARDLSFMRFRKPKGSGIDYWNVESTGSYGDDCELGRSLAREYLAYLADHPTNGNVTLLGCIVMDLVESKAVNKAAVIGFMMQVNAFAMAGMKAAHLLGEVTAPADKATQP